MEQKPEKSLWERTLDFFTLGPSKDAMDKAGAKDAPSTDPSSSNPVDFVKSRYKRMMNPEVDALGQKKKKKVDTGSK